MASKRKSDDVNVVAPDKTKELTGSGENGSLISEHYQNILNNWQSMQELWENHLGMMEFKYRFKEKINFYKAVA